MKESTIWIIVIGAVAIAGMGFASMAKDANTQVLIGGFASSICVSLLTYAQSNKVVAKQEAQSAKVDAVVEKVEVATVKADVAAVAAGVAAKNAEATANLVQENATFTDERLAKLKTVALDTQKTTDAVYKLSNSAMAAALGLTAAMARRLADGPDATEEDERVAVKAEKDFREHQEKQRQVDAAPGGPPHPGHEEQGRGKP
jgi:hypothetical protein